MSNVVDFGYLDDVIVATSPAVWTDSSATAAVWASIADPSNTWRAEQRGRFFDSQPGNFDDDTARPFDAH